MRIRYIGAATVRIVGRYRWDPSNKHTCTVPDRLGVELLTHPGNQFAIAPEDPRKRRGLSDEEICAQALEKIGK